MMVPYVLPAENDCSHPLSLRRVRLRQCTCTCVRYFRLKLSLKNEALQMQTPGLKLKTLRNVQSHVSKGLCNSRLYIFEIYLYMYVYQENKVYCVKKYNDAHV